MGFPSDDWGQYVVALPNQGGYLISADRGGQDGVISPSTTNYEIELFQTDPNGTLLDTFRLGGPNSDYSQNLFVQRNKVYVIGKTASPWFFPPVQAVRPYTTLKQTTSVSRFGLWPLGIARPDAGAGKEFFTISPNPSTGTGFKISFLQPHRGGRVQLYSASGALVGSWPVAAGITAWQLPVAQPAPGTYLVRWQPTYGAATTQKLIIQ
jgi:hypothetical protein